MIGIVVVTHGHLAEEMLRTLEAVLGGVVGVAAVSAAGTSDPEALRAEVHRAVARVETGEGTLILTDMLGDTATNVSLSESVAGRLEVVAGVNMPMLVKAVTGRGTMPLRELAEFIHEYGRSHIFWASRGGAVTTPPAAQSLRKAPRE
jgi:PTS system mannose-specific IIA component